MDCINESTAQTDDREEFEDFEARSLAAEIGMNNDLDAQEPRDIEVITAEINFYKSAAGEAILEIGARLIEAKTQLNHGEWTDWLEQKVSFSESTAQRFMRLAKEYPKPSALTVLGASKALQLLALPASERDEFIAEKHEVNGREKTVQEMSTRELQKAIKERDDALRKAQDLSARLEDTQKALANSQAADTEARMKLEQARQDLKAADDEGTVLEKELEELRNRPIEVATAQPSEEQLDEIRRAAAEDAAKAARQQAEQELKAKIEKAEAAKQKALDAKSKAEQDLAALKATHQQTESVAEQEKKILSDRCAELQKKLAVASSSEMTVFKTHFENAQAATNKMLASMNSMIEGGDKEGGLKLGSALWQFCKAVMDSLPAECAKGASK